MTEFIDAYSQILTDVFNMPLIRFALALIPIFLLGPVFRAVFSIIDYQPDFLGFLGDFFRWLGGKIVTWMCSSERGFKLAYILGWARQGIDFFDCGLDCDKCPKYSQCDNELRVVLDVTQVQEGGDGDA